MNAERRRSLALLLAAGLAPTTRSWAQAGTAWPTRPVRLLVGFPPGSTPDLSARAIAEPLAKAWGQPVVVENKPGAGGNIATQQVATATDDHTLGVVINGNLTSAPLLFSKLGYAPAKDLSFLSLLTTAPLVLVTTPDKPAGAAFFAAAREGGDKWNYGSVGIGSVGHLGMELLNARAGLKAVHVPFQGNPQVVTAMLAGQVQMALIPPGLAMPQVRAGKLKAIGVTSAGRSTLVTELEPLSAAGVGGSSGGPKPASAFELEVWTALVGPATLSKAAFARIQASVSGVVRDAETRQRLFNAGWQAVGSAPEALVSRVKAETESLGAIIKARGIKVE
jgi:tripartite-type tricarboxylate transporter receptor subunit TctC